MRQTPAPAERLIVGPWLLAFVFGLPATALAERAGPRAQPARIAQAAAAPVCVGDYADDLNGLSSRVRELARDPGNQYSYCLRTTAIYECLSYAPDGSIRRGRKTVIGHGTGFAYRRSAGETFLLTNDHVATWPAVTDEQHTVEEVPIGCKMVNESIKIVDDEGDEYEPNDVVLTRVVGDPQLDLAVLKTRAPLKVIPYRIGRSAALRAGNVVAVHGFPLGAFQAMNQGKVVNAFDHDTSGDWDHIDFVVDALLSPGNSGSPVLAVSCRTGEYELVGVYHAGYTNGSALNIVVGIDQARELMTSFKRAPRVAEPTGDLSAEERRTLWTATSNQVEPFYFPFGNLVAVARRPVHSAAVSEQADAGALLFEVYSRGFPLHAERLLVVEDFPVSDTNSQRGRVFFGNHRGLRAFSPAALDADAQAQLQRIAARLRAGALATVRFRAADSRTRQGIKRLQALERTRDRQAAVERDAAQSLIDLADRLGPKLSDPVTAYADAVAPGYSDAPPKPLSPSVAEAPASAPGR